MSRARTTASGQASAPTSPSSASSAQSAPAAYQLIKKFNCHEPGCWRVGTHLAAGGQFALCYRHHPDYQGKRPTHDLIVKLHRENAEREAAIHWRLVEIQQRLTARAAATAGVETAAGPDHRPPPIPGADGHP